MKFPAVLASLCLALAAAPVAHADLPEDQKLMESGGTQTFDTTGHLMSAGVKLKIAYPKTWKAVEVTARNTVQKFINDDGRGRTSVGLLIFAPPAATRDLTAEEKGKLLSQEYMKRQLAMRDKIVSYKAATVGGIDCGVLESIGSSKRDGLDGPEITIYKLSYLIPLNRSMVVLQCVHGGEASAVADIKKRFAEAKPIFEKMAASVVFAQ